MFFFKLDPPMIISSPKSKRVKAGSSATLTCKVQAPKDLAFTIKWLKDGLPITGANESTFGLASVQAADQGSYQCEVLTIYGSEKSAPALVVMSGNWFGNV